ncbi:MAG: hypothetical protein QXU26_02680 [Thermofilaceae archaeon]
MSEADVTFERFCEEYPEYCSKALFVRLFGGTLSISEVRSQGIGATVSFRGIVVSRSVRRTRRRDLVGYTIQVCDKTDCIDVSGVVDDEGSVPSEGAEVLVRGTLGEWQGRLEVKPFELRKLSDVRSRMGKGGERKGKRSEKGSAEVREAQQSEVREEQVREEQKNPVELFLNVIREANARGTEVMLERAERLARRFGLDWASVEQYLEVYEKEAGDGTRQKYVRVRQSA